MDYELAALKLLIGHLKAISSVASDSRQRLVLGTLPFQRAWLQGILVAGSEPGSKILDDGSGVIELQIPNDLQDPLIKTGNYVLVVGAYILRNGVPYLKVHKIVDLSSSPDREAMWNLEVIEAFNLFYSSYVQQ